MVCIPDAVLESGVSHPALVLYLHLARLLTSEQVGPITREALGALIGVKIRSVDVFLSELKQAGLVEIERDEATRINSYRLPLQDPSSDPFPRTVKPVPKITGTPRRRPAGVAKSDWEEHCTTRIAAILKELPECSELAAWRKHVATARPPARALPMEMSDMEAFLEMHKEGLDWRRGVRVAMEKGATAIKYVEVVAQSAKNSRPTLTRSTAAPPRAKTEADLEEERIAARAREIAARQYAGARQ